MLQGIVPLERVRAQAADYFHTAVVYTAPVFRHTHFDGRQVVVWDLGDLAEPVAGLDGSGWNAPDELCVALGDALQSLAQVEPRLARVVDCRFFAGYTDNETADILGLTARTVRRDWVKARAWLRESSGAAPAAPSQPAANSRSDAGRE